MLFHGNIKNGKKITAIKFNNKNNPRINYDIAGYWHCILQTNEL